MQFVPGIPHTQHEQIINCKYIIFAIHVQMLTPDVMWLLQSHLKLQSLSKYFISGQSDVFANILPTNKKYCQYFFSEWWKLGFRKSHL